ncbi:hypothetical protein AS593_07520 [Caulobacter vibrioides]|nr:hypothetical protein AS593_07520 [Caulobacter vibrioides]
MSRLIKFGVAAPETVRAMDAARPSPAAEAKPSAGAPVQRPEDELIQTLRSRIAALEDGVAKRDAELATLPAALEGARKEGREEGRRQGLSEARDRAEEALDALKASADAALERYSQELGSLERLAPALAREALARLIAQPDERAALLADVIQTQIRQLDRNAVVAVEVSRHDYPAPEALETLAQRLGASRFEVRADEALPAGGCRLRLVLGAIEIGLDQQWRRLDDLLSALAQPGGTR